MKRKHLSFDFWNTLVSANPLYTNARTKFLSDMTGLSEATVRTVYTTVKSRLDNAAETSGASTPYREIHQILLDELRNADGVVEIEPHQFTDMLFGIFQTLPPLMPERMPFLLNRAYRLGYTLSVGSNTNFIPGRILRTSLENIPFDFTLFSDEIETSKPSRDFARSIIGMTEHTHSKSHDDINIRHVGDNLICDDMQEYDIWFKHVNNPTQTMEFLETL